MEKEMIAQRLAYLWDFRDKDPRQYIENGFGIEKENIYWQYGSDKDFMVMAYEMYNELGRSFNESGMD